MTPRLGNVIFCFILTLVTCSQGLNFTIDTTPGSVTCGSLHCSSTKGITDNITSIVGLVIYDVTQVNAPVKLVSISSSDPDLCVPGSEINDIKATGNASRNHAELSVAFLDTSFCSKRSFVCELEFVDDSGSLDVTRQTVTVESDINCNEVRCVKGAPHNNSREQFLLWGKTPALCDTETDGGGWIIIQRRTKGDVNFYRGWNDYKNGFGTPDTDFWIGNDNIHNLTKQNNTELRVDLEYQGKQYFAQYSSFSVAAETSFYRLSVSGYSGTVNDSLAYHNGRNFTTFDKSNGGFGENNCASYYHGAWWYNHCYTSNLNGVWGAQDGSGLAWIGLVYPGSVSASEMKIRHV